MKQGVWQGHRKFDLFAERDEDVHSSQRRLVNNIYSMASLKDFEGKVDEVVAHFMGCISKESSEVTVDIGKWVQLFAFGKLAYPGSLEPLIDCQRRNWRDYVLKIIRLS
jgi:hypothetical protein